MGSRRLSRHGFAVQVEIPDAVGARVRYWLGRGRPAEPAPPGLPGLLPDGIVLRPPPAIDVLRRDPQRALDFLRDPALQGDGAPSPKLLAYLDEAARTLAAASTLAEKVAAVPWYHTIELPGGVVTPGTHDHRHLVRHLGLPTDLTGMRCLDVATFDGFWAFELERRGGEVVAVDLPSTDGLDLPTGVHQILVAEHLVAPFGAGFAVASAALGSRVTREARSVYDLSPDDLGRFDLVFVGDLLLHLRRPLDALRAIRSVTGGTLILADRYVPELTGLPGRLIGYEGGWHGIEWWRPSLDALAQMVVDAGFDHLDVRGVYRLPMAKAPADNPGWHRAVIHAS